MLRQHRKFVASCVVLASIAGLGGCSGDMSGNAPWNLGGPRNSVDRPVAVGYVPGSGKAGSHVVVVKAGDTLASLSRRHDVSIADLMVVNGLRDAAIVRGQILLLPDIR